MRMMMTINGNDHPSEQNENNQDEDFDDIDDD